MYTFKGINKMDFKICTVTFLFLFTTIIRAKDICQTIVAPDFKSCTKHGVALPVHECKQNDICNKTFLLSRIELEPMSSRIIPTILDSIFDFCCGPCTKRFIVNNFTQVNMLNFSTLSSSDFVYPVLSKPTTTDLYGFYFIPLIEAPSTFLISKTMESEQILQHLVYAAAHLWPFLVVCLLMAFLAGFPVWLMETRSNRDEFPRPFLIGLFEGFWWSFVTMTTVGYGDKAPKFLVSRLFAVIWIVIGITTMSMFTANLTMEIMRTTSPPSTAMIGTNIGVLKDRVYDATVVLQKGGFVESAKNEGLQQGLVELVTKLREDRLKAFLIDRHVYMYAIKYYRNISRTEGHEEHRDAVLFLNHTTHTHLTHGSEKRFSYGVLVKEFAYYEYFRHFVRDNQRDMQLCKELYMHHRAEKIAERKHVFSTKYDLFRTAVMNMAIIIGVLLFVGIIYEFFRYIRRQQKLRKETLLQGNVTLVTNSLT